MKFSKHLIIISLLILMIMVFSACGENRSDSTKDEAKLYETTVVLETTSDGGTVEQDTEGNKITRNQDGHVIKVEDKDGNLIDVTEYLKSHARIENPKDVKSDSFSSDNSKDIADDRKSELQSDEGEGDIHLIIATIPDDEDMIGVPDL